MGDKARALVEAHSVIERMWDINDVPGAIAFVAYGGSILSEYEPTGALRIGAAAIALRAQSGGALRPEDYGFSTALEILESTTDPDVYSEAVTAGEALSLEDAVEETLMLLSRTTAINTTTRTIS